MAWCHAWWAALPWPLLGGPPVVAELTGMLGWLMCFHVLLLAFVFADCTN